MVDDIEMARPKGLLIPFDKFVILDILPPEQYKNVLTKMRQYVGTAGGCCKAVLWQFVQR